MLKKFILLAFFVALFIISAEIGKNYINSNRNWLLINTSIQEVNMNELLNQFEQEVANADSDEKHGFIQKNLLRYKKYLENLLYNSKEITPDDIIVYQENVERLNSLAEKLKKNIDNY